MTRKDLQRLKHFARLKAGDRREVGRAARFFLTRMLGEKVRWVPDGKFAERRRVGGVDVPVH